MRANDNLKKIVVTALMAALVLVFSLIQIPLAEGARIHLGNGMCLLAGLILTPVTAGLAAGIGSLLFDVIFYPIGFEFLITFLTKFIMAFVCGIVYKTLSKKDNSDKKYPSIITSSSLGELAYIILYMLKSFIDSYIILGNSIEATRVLMWIKLGSSFLNAVFAVIMAGILYQVVKKIKI